MTGTYRAEWLKAPRWSVSHLVVTAPESDRPRDGHWGTAACGRALNNDKLEPEPTGIDTVNRCSRCRAKAPEYGADDDE